MPDGHASPAGNPLKRSTPSSPRNSARNLHSATPRGSSNRNLLNRGNLTAQASFRNAVRNVRGSAKFSPHLHTVHKFELEPTPFDADDHVMACIDYIHDETFLQVRELERTTKIWSYTAQTTATALMEALKAATQTTTPTAPSKTDMVEPTSVGDPLLEAVMNQVPEAPQPAAIDAQCPFEISTRAPIESFGIAHTNVRKRSHSNRRLGLVRTNSYRSKLDLLSRLSSSSSSIRKKNQNAAKDDTPRQPIVFSIDPDPSTKPRLSPRKSIALLRSALRMSQGFIFPGAAPSAAQAAAPTHPSQPAPSPRQKSSPRRVAKVVKAKAAPCMWEPCYPDKPLVDENPPVSVEYNVRRNQTSGLPDLRPGRSASIAVPRPLVLSDEVTVAPDQSYLGEFTKSDRYEEDLTSVGHQIDGIVLSPGVKLQAGEVTKSGPNLPDLPAHMRKAVYEEEPIGLIIPSVAEFLPPSKPALHGVDAYGEQAADIVALQELLEAIESNEDSSEIDFVVERPASARSTASTSSQLIGSAKQNKIQRPCTSDGNSNHARTKLAKSTEHRDAAPATGGVMRAAPIGTTTPVVAEVAKQRAFMRRPSLVSATESFCKSTRSHRNVQPPSAPPSRRKLHARDPRTDRDKPTSGKDIWPTH